ncbi:MAG TPA: hypothetical protein PLZ57_05110 [Pseudobdellovibrionaceae bacterium]|nr:hypothetical protein [Pseudobdellovibrionaceae bacterium]
MTSFWKIETNGRVEVSRAEVEPISDTMRWRRTLQASVAFAIASLVSILIPIAHFLLTPGFALAALVVFFKRSREGYRLDLAAETCRVCGQGFVERQIFAGQGRFKLFCYSCRTEAYLLSPDPTSV